MLDSGTITRLFRTRHYHEAKRFCDGLFTASKERALRVHHVTTGQFARACEVRQRYRDLRIGRVLTADAHFRQPGFGFELLP